MSPRREGALASERFQVVRRLGQGGMGVVYEAVDRERNTRVALKTLHARLGPEAVLRFRNEFRALADLEHTNLVSLGEFFELGGEHYFTMELIDGLPFVEWVRGTGGGPLTDAATAVTAADPRATPAGTRALDGGSCDVARLRAALPQLASAVYALHAAGKVHRDIKPGNVLVSREGRVVLLDFGLVTNAAKGESWLQGERLGTPEYMAPEQAAGQPVGPEADWYSVGVVLYRALTGRLPFRGPTLEVLANKQRFEPPPPREHWPEVPADLDALCTDLLRFEPRSRPSGRAVLRSLGIEPSDEAPSVTSITTGQVFVGRKDELDRLRDSLREVESGRPVAVLVRGESGLGKTALVRHFTDSLQQEDAGTLVLQGRCHEREWIAFKAFDGVVADLARHLRRLADPELLALAPPHAALLGQVFPALRRVEALSRAPRTLHTAVDPQQQRARLFGALRELLARLGQRCRLVIVIDDLQWADADSLALLEEILRPPAPRALLVATSRAGHAAVPPAGRLEVIELPRLRPGEAWELAVAVAARLVPGTASDAAELARESEGHPLFLAELVRYAATLGDRGPGPLRLDEALWARISRLDAPARELLELVAVSGAPLAREALAQAMNEDPSRNIALLSTIHLLRRTGVRGTEAVEPSHDRVREAVLAHLAPSERCALHHRLAAALEDSGRGDPEALAIHWREAGEPARAHAYAARAAELAAAGLAFDRAAALYRLALELGTPSSAGAVALRTRLGEALANVGRGAEAAQAYLEALGGANAAQALDLRRRAAEQLLRSGHIDQGIAAFSQVLAAVDMRPPETPRRALLSLLARRARLRLRGLGFRERDESQIAAEDLTRIDTCWSGGTGLGIVDPVRGADFQARHFLLALEAGEPNRIARALAFESCFVVTAGQPARRRAFALVERAEALARRLAHPDTTGWATTAAGMCHYQLGEWRAALERGERAAEVFRSQCRGLAWELHSTELYCLWSLYYLGEIALLTDRVPILLKEALERGDLYAATNLRTGIPNFAWLARGDVAGARRETGEGMRRWSPRGFHVQHYWDLLALTHIDLFCGDAAAAHRRIGERWPPLARSLLLRVQAVRVEAWDLRARAALALAAAGAPEARALVAAARRDARRIAAERTPASRGLALLLSVGADAALGDGRRAAERLPAASAAFRASGMELLATVADARAAQLAGDAGRFAACQTWLRERAIADPERVIDLFAPGWP